MKVCYFIQSHKNPKQICRLIRIIKRYSPNSQVLIDHDFSTSYLDPAEFKDCTGIDLIKRQKPAKRGDASILETYLNAVNWLFSHGSDFDWLISLSGQDYPTQPIGEIEAFLSKTQYDGFIRYHDLLAEKSAWSKKNVQRFFAQYVRLPKSTDWLLRKYSSKINERTPLIAKWQYSMLGIPTKTPFTDEFRCYRGWHWHTLSRACVVFLLDYLKENPKLFNFYKRTIGPEESLIQTVLVNSGRFNLCNDDKRYYVYPLELRGYARSLTVEDYDTITNGNFHFARKFEPELDSKILDLLDTQILNQTPNFTQKHSSIQC
jgi:hypothetical protein